MGVFLCDETQQGGSQVTEGELFGQISGAAQLSTDQTGQDSGDNGRDLDTVSNFEVLHENDNEMEYYSRRDPRRGIGSVSMLRPCA